MLNNPLVEQAVLEQRERDIRAFRLEREALRAAAEIARAARPETLVEGRRTLSDWLPNWRRSRA